jgi:putative ABC transport system permease protein
MRDWRSYLNEHLDLPAMKGFREEWIIEEIAGQLEDFYREGLSRGMNEQEADAYARGSIPDWADLQAQLAATNQSHRTSPATTWYERSEQAVRGRGRFGQRLGDLMADLRQTFRSIRFEPGFWIVSVAVLGLGIGATTTIFSVVDGVMLKRLPFEDAGRLVFFDDPSFSVPRYRDYKEHITTLSDIEGSWTREVDYAGGERPVRLNAGMATEGFLDFFRAELTAGRFFAEEDFVWEPQAALFSHFAWQRHFGGDPDLVGRSISLNGRGDRKLESGRIWQPPEWTPEMASFPYCLDPLARTSRLLPVPGSALT